MVEVPSTPIPPHVPAEAAALAARIVGEQLGGTFWAPPPTDACLMDRRTLVLATDDTRQTLAMLNTALDAGEAAKTVLLLTRPDRRLEAAAARAGAAVHIGPADPWPLLTGATALHADASSRLAYLGRLAGVPLHSPAAGPATLGTEAEFAAAALLLGARYADPYRGGAITCAEALDIVAEWRRITRANRAIGACTGMSFWKRRRMRAFLHDGNRAPPHRATARAAVRAAGGLAIAAWSSRIPAGLPEPVLRVEDGFIRSRGLGSGFLPPCSIIVDAAGIYYDPSRPSDLEILLRHTEFPPALLDRARRLTARLVSEAITKYSAGAAPPTLPDSQGRRRILVPGQVADDLSVLHGGAGVAGNLDLLARVRAANPDAFVIYKPHPDVDAGHRAGAIPDGEARRHADLVIRDGAIASLIAAVDEVHTITSLAGFEALLRGRTVVTYGQPFYAGWGLTQDLAPLPRRARRLTIDELAAGVLLLYPRHIDPVTELPCHAELLLDRLSDPSLWRPTLLMRIRAMQGQWKARATRSPLRMAATLAAAPLWAAQLLTGAKSFADNPLIGSRRLNARGLHVARMRLAHRLAEKRRAALAHHIDPADRDAFERDGYVVKRDFLPPDVFEALRAQVAAYRGHAREMQQGGTTTRRISLDPANLAQIPAIRTLMSRADWNGLLRYVWSFDASPMVYVQTILSPGATAEDPQCVLHADTFHPTVKAWLFLTDVASDEGPFTYVPGSHRPTAARLAWEKQNSLGAAASPNIQHRRGSFRIDASELPALGLPPPVAFAVPANTLVVADTGGFHARGPSARPTRRVEVWAYGRRNPFLPWVGLDPWGLSRLADYRVPLFWRFGDLTERLGLGRNVWRARENVSAFD